MARTISSKAAASRYRACWGSFKVFAKDAAELEAEQDLRSDYEHSDLIEGGFDQLR